MTIPCSRSIAILEDAPLLASLEDILPLEEFLAPVGQHKQNLQKTIECIEACNSTDLDKVPWQYLSR